MGANDGAAVSFEVPADWVLPELGAIATSRQLTTVYFDTADHDLLAAGVTLARCAGAGADGWRLDGPGLRSGHEIVVPANGRVVPTELRALVRGLCAGAPLRQVARVKSEQTIHLVSDGAGAPGIEITDATVTSTVLDTPMVVRTWRTIDARRVGNADPHTLRAMTRRFEKADAARTKRVPALARALGHTAERRARPRSLGDLITRYLDRQREVILETDVALRRGDDAVVHRTRIAIRRYRSVLRVFADVLDGAPTEHLDGELSWYAGALGSVRDHQVLRERLAELRRHVPDDVVLGPIDARLAAILDAEEQHADRALSRVMSGPRYAALIAELNAWHRRPPLAGPTRAARTVRGYVESADRRATKRLTGTRHHAFDRELSHRARKAVKRARYVAELAEPVLGKPARRLKKRSKRAQQRLGAVQDSTIVLEFLRRAASGEPGEIGFAFGYLSALEMSRSQPLGNR